MKLGPGPGSRGPGGRSPPRDAGGAGSSAPGYMLLIGPLVLGFLLKLGGGEDEGAWRGMRGHGRAWGCMRGMEGMGACSFHALKGLKLIKLTSF